MTYCSLAADLHHVMDPEQFYGWRATVSVAENQERLASLEARDGRVVGAWVVLAASFLVPMAVLILAYPDFVAGG